MIRQLDDRTLVSGQIAPHEVAGLAGQGITVLVNNRPDGEEPDQPLAADIEAAAEAGRDRLPLRADHPRHRPGRCRGDAGGAARGRRRQDARLLPLGHALGIRLCTRACAKKARLAEEVSAAADRGRDSIPARSRTCFRARSRRTGRCALRQVLVEHHHSDADDRSFGIAGALRVEHDRLDAMLLKENSEQLGLIRPS